MIGANLETKIPNKLKTEKIWTFTRTDIDPKTQKNLKVPMDPIALDLGVYQGISDPNHLVDFETLKKVRNVPDNWEPAFRLNALQNQWAVVDVEPDGVVKDNPYLTIRYTYAEASRHDGLHGLIQLDPSYDFMKKMVVKIPKWNTEILLNNHFITITSKPPVALYNPSIDDVSLISAGIQECATTAQTTETNQQSEVSLEYVEQNLAEAPKFILDTLDIEMLARPMKVDNSAWEFEKLLSQYHWLFRHRYMLMKNLAIDDRVALLYQIALRLLPYRPKFEKTFHDNNHDDNVNYLFYTVRRIVETTQK